MLYLATKNDFNATNQIAIVCIMEIKMKKRNQIMLEGSLQKGLKMPDRTSMQQLVL
jgi:hypothetical protein